MNPIKVSRKNVTMATILSVRKSPYADRYGCKEDHRTTLCSIWKILFNDSLATVAGAAANVREIADVLITIGNTKKTERVIVTEIQESF